MNNNLSTPLVKAMAPGKMSSLAIFNTAFNVMLGTGPILVPPVFQQPGIILAFIFIIGITFMSYVCAEFVIETMSILSAIRARKAAYEQIEQEENDAIANGNKKKRGNNQDSDYSNKDSSNSSLNSQFEYKESIEYGQMGLEIFGQKGQIFVTSVLVIFLVGILSSKTIMIGSILSKAFSGVYLLGNRQAWIIAFFTICVIFSFKSVTNTKMLQNIIILVRFFTIAALLIGTFQVAIIDGFHSIDELGTYFSFDNFSSFFNNLQFALLMHHAIPPMFANINNQKDVKKVLVAAFGIGSVSLVFLSLLGVMSFGDCLNTQKIAGCGNVPTSSYFSNFFKGTADADWVFYITSFYIFLNIAAFPVLIITARNNFMKLLIPSKMSPQITKWTVIFTAIVTGPIIAIALLTTNIQMVIDWVSGIFGSMLFSIFPTTFVIFARRKADKMGIDYSQSLHRPTLPQKQLPFMILGVASVLLVYTLYNNFKKYT